FKKYFASATKLGGALRQEQERSNLIPKTAEGLAKNVRGCLEKLRDVFWSRHALNENFPTRIDPDLKPNDPETAFWHSVEDFVDVNLVIYLNQFAIYLRHQLFMLSVSALLLLFAVTTYRAEPHELLLSLVDLLLIASVAISVYVVVSINLDEVF